MPFNSLLRDSIEMEALRGVSYEEAATFNSLLRDSRLLLLWDRDALRVYADFQFSPLSVSRHIHALAVLGVR